MPQPSKRVIVIGAGPVGLCLALALAQQGVAVTLIEALGEDNFLEQVPRAGTNHPATLEDAAIALGFTKSSSRAASSRRCSTTGTAPTTN